MSVYNPHIVELANMKLKVINVLIIFLYTMQEEIESKDTQLQQKDEQLLKKERQLQEMDRQLRGTAPPTSEQQSAITVSLRAKEVEKDDI